MLRYHQFVRLKASSYFLAGGDSEDLIQEGMVGLYKAVRDYRDDRQASFRSFAELCITRQIITAIKTATRQKHVPLNGYLSFSHRPATPPTTASARLADVLPGSSDARPGQPGHLAPKRSTSLKQCLTRMLSDLESRVLRLYLQGLSLREASPAELDCDCKTVDNALQRIKRKVDLHLESRKVLLLGAAAGRREVAAQAGAWRARGAAVARSASASRAPLEGHQADVVSLLTARAA